MNMELSLRTYASMAPLRDEEMISHLTFLSIFSSADRGILRRSQSPRLSAAAWN